MVNWRVTATTIYCESVEDEAVLMVYKDGSAKCAAYKKYGQPSPEIVRLLKKRSQPSRRELRCEGPECSRLIQYRGKLFAEEAQKGHSEKSHGETAKPPHGERGHHR